jgi:hypothetical protein
MERKEDILKALHILQGFQHSMVRIDDWICITGRSYDRHSTSFGKTVMEIQEFRVRFSGSMATLYAPDQQVEFRTDAIQHVETSSPDSLVIEMNLAAGVWRRISVSKIAGGV